MNSKGELFGISVVTRHFWVLMNARIGVDFEWNPETAGPAQLGDLGLNIDMQHLAVTVHSQNTVTWFQLTEAGLISISVNVTNRQDQHPDERSCPA